MEKKYYNNYNISKSSNKNKLHPSFSYVSSSNYHSNNNMTERSINSNANIELLKDKIKSQNAQIVYLEKQLQNYDNTINEITNLNLQINKMNEILKNKNKTILEYQNLSEISKIKLNNYINKTNEKRHKFQKNLENYEDLKSKNNNLIEQIQFLEKENNALKHQLNTIKNKNVYDIDNLKNEIDVINIEYEKEKKQNKLINDEKIKSNKEIIDLKTKLITCEKFKEEMNNIKNKYNLLEEQINEKDKEIEKLMDINNDLKARIDISTDNYNKAAYDHKNLEIRLKSLMDKVKNYEMIYNESNYQNNNIFNKSVNNYDYKLKNNFENSDVFNYSINKHPIRNYNYKINDNKNDYIGRNSKSPVFISKRNLYNFNYKNY